MIVTDVEVEGDPPEDEEGAADLYRAIGRQIRHLREKGGLTQRELAERVGFSEDLISSIERGRRVPQPEFLALADEVLGAVGLLKVAAKDIERAKARAKVRHPAWFRDYARLESEAVELNFYSTLTVPGLLQTAEYARAIFSAYQPVLTEETIEQRVAARMARQDILTRWPAPTVTAVIDESILKRRIGGRGVLEGQLKHLLKLGELRSTTIHVLPLVCEEHAGYEGPFVLLAPRGKHQVAYLEVQGDGRLVAVPEAVRTLAARYGNIRGQALTSGASMSLIEETLGGS